MKNNLLSVITGVLATIAIVLCAVVVIERNEKQFLAGQNLELKRSLGDFREQLEEVQAQQAIATAVNEEKEKPLEFVSLASVPYQASAFIGDDYLGHVWIMHAESPKQKTSDGGPVYFPVVRIDEQLKGRFTTIMTNVVERAVVRNTSNYNQDYQNIWYYGRNNYGRSTPAPHAPLAPVMPSPPNAPIAPPGNPVSPPRFVPPTPITERPRVTPRSSRSNTRSTTL